MDAVHAVIEHALLHALLVVTVLVKIHVKLLAVLPVTDVKVHVQEVALRIALENV